MKGFNKKRAQLAPQQHPTLQPLPSFSAMTSPVFAGPHPMQTHVQRAATLDGLNVDLDAFLGTLGATQSAPDDLDLFTGLNTATASGAPNPHDTSSAIFLPVDSTGPVDFGTTSPNAGLAQWVSVALPASFSTSLPSSLVLSVREHHI